MKRILVLFLLLSLASCARTPKYVWTELPSAETLLQQVSATTGQVDSLDGVATVSLNVAEKFFSSQQFLLLEKPDRLRADVLTGFGQLIMQLTSTGEELSVFNNTTVPGHFYRGPATTENLFQFTRIPLSAKDIVQLLLYDPPLIDYQQSEVLVADGDLLLRLTNPELEQELLFNTQMQLSGCRYYTKGEVLLEVLYQEIDKESIFPQTIRLDVVAEKTKVSIKFSELQTNVEIPAARFQLKKPEKIPLEALP